ncbi:hypothetical protein [Shinella zoogloeoides]|uniref:hypothetical protein n=1 Tax=Shinella zoogloeoides TaxID=352475 RepID=UPI00273E2ED6|nr:hypothetical protein [Shinella zoogloeoides]WLR92910.1 hypothetical protein Q9316_01500 [Shinella zoogloeoides]
MMDKQTAQGLIDKLLSEIGFAQPTTEQALRLLRLQSYVDGSDEPEEYEARYSGNGDLDDDL